MRLVDADVFLLELTHWKGTDGNYHENSQTFYTLDEVMDAIEEADVEAEPVKRGRWVITNAYPYRVYCSECYATFIPSKDGIVWKENMIPRNFCPNCGARMENDGTEAAEQ